MMSAPDDEAFETSAEELAQALASTSPPLLIDVREPHEVATGMIGGARLAPLAELGHLVSTWNIDPQRRIVVYCAGGQRSADGAHRIRGLGYATVRSLHGGITAWRRHGLPIADPPRDVRSGLTTAQLERYARQVRLPGFGIAGQRRLLDARVLCVGAGGLGSPACLYLAAAGVGEIGIVDDDVVALGNLHRQILHATSRVGTPKTDSAVKTLAALNPEVRVRAHRTRLQAANALDILAGYDVVLDGSDNFATRYVVNDAALRLRKPLISGAVLRYEGQVAVFEGAPCYRCLFPQPPPQEAAPSCSEAGVLGVVPGIVGTMQAAEALKLILGVGEPLRARLLTFDALSMSFSALAVRAAPHCTSCGPRVDRASLELRDVPDGCRDPGG